MAAKKISGSKFEPLVDLGPDDLATLAVPGFGQPSQSALRRHGWNGGCAGIVGLALAADNLRVLSANFFLLGPLHETPTAYTALKAQKIWPTAPISWELRLPLDDLSIFRFDGSLQSGHVSSASLQFEVFDTARSCTVPGDQIKAGGGGDFSLRALAHMTTSIYFKVAILILPLAAEVVSERFPFAKDKHFPGLKLASFEASLLPNAAKKYGLAFLPLLQKGDADAPFPQAPSFSLREASSKLLQTGAMAKVISDLGRLEAKLKRLEDNGAEELTAPTTPTPKWPDAKPSPSPEQQEESSEGRKVLLLNLNAVQVRKKKKKKKKKKTKRKPAAQPGYDFLLR